MGVDLFFSNHLEHLAEKLALNISEKNHPADDPFRPVKVIVPNANLAKWLTLVLARRDAIVMNVDFQFLETGLWEMLSALNPQLESAQRLDKTKTRLLVLAVLSRIESDNPDLAPVTNYLFGQNGHKPPDYAIRLWQLSERLAHLFQEYEYHRTDMIHRWRAGHTESDDLAQCEQSIYLAMGEVKRSFEARNGEPVLSLMEYAERIFSRAEPLLNNGPEKGRVHVFGLTQVSAFHLSLIDRLTPYYDIYLYALNPSQEFWEDIRTPAEKRWIKHHNKRLSLQDEEQAAGELFDVPDHPLLAAWGKPGRESVRLLCQLTNYSFQAGFSPIGPIDTVLKFVQHDILTLGSDTGLKRLNQDHSLQIYGCPGLQREVETVYQNICYNLSQNDRLQLTDIAVLVPDITVYKPLFDLVFNRVPHRLAYNLVDSRADIESVYGQAVMGMLALTTGRFSRKAVFELILNPCFLHQWHLETDEVRTWATWAEALNIFHAYAKSDPPADNTPPSGRYTFKQGLQRLRLARIFSTDSTADTLLHYEHLVPFADPDTSDSESVEKFCLVIEALDRVAHTLRLKSASAVRWRSALLDATRELLSIPPDYRGEIAVQKGLVTTLDDLVLLDHLHGDENPPTLDAAMLTEYLRFCLGAISGGKGDYLTGGVTISELTPMRPIPFKIIYILGMEEGGFPGRADSSVLDLRLKQRRIGDINLPERNRYLFLETVLAAREKLYISYISHDLQKDRVLPPSNVVHRLKTFIENKVLPKETLFQLGTIPLKGSSLKYLKEDAVNTWLDVRVSAELVDRVAGYRFSGQWSKVQARFNPLDMERIDRLNPDFSIPEAPQPSISEKSEANDDLHLGCLSRFLENPLRETIHHHLGLFEEEEGLEEQVQIEDEPFASQYPLDWRLKMGPVHRWLDAIFNGSHDAEELRPTHHTSQQSYFEQTYADYYRQGATPENDFASVDKASLQTEVSHMQTVISPLIDRIMSADDIVTAAIIGAPADPSGPLTGGRVKRIDPLPISIPDPEKQGQISNRIFLHGQLRWMWRENKTGWHVLVPTSIKRLNKKPRKHLLAPILFYLACLTAKETRDWMDKKPLTIHLTGAEKSVEFTFHSHEKDANEYLFYLITASLKSGELLWMPFEAITQCAVNPLAVDPTTIDEDLRIRFRDEMIEAFAEKSGELEQLVNPVFPDDFLERAVKRFQIFGKLRAATG